LGEALVTAEERAAVLVKEDGGGDYYYEGWALEDSIALAILAAENDALERAARAVDYLAAHTSREDEEQRVILNAYAEAAACIRALKVSP
jgi:hypothetical protein